MKRITAVVVGLSLGGIALADTIYVPADYPTIQEAIDASSDGDVIQIAGGTYTESVNPSGKAITILGETANDGSLTVVIDGQGASSVMICSSGEEKDTVLENLVMTNGNAEKGGGIYCDNSSPLIRNCNVSNNQVTLTGGGLFCRGGAPHISNSRFTGNLAGELGGGVFCDAGSTASFTDTVIEQNIANFGGGIFNGYCAPKLTNCQLQGNSALGSGGGMANVSNSSPELLYCSFTDNLASLGGGGVYNENSSAILLETLFIENNAMWGGALYEFGSSSSLHSCSFTNNFASDHGGGIQTDQSTSSLEDCSFESNIAAGFGGGMTNVFGSTPTLVNCTFTGNSADYGGGMESYESSPHLSNCTFTTNTANFWGGGMSQGNAGTTLENCTFTDNLASVRGGGIYNQSGNSNMSDCSFTNNTSTYGGGLYSSDSNQNLTVCNFTNNNSTSGGGLYSSDCNLILIDSVFTGNSSSSGSGGGILSYSSLATMTGCAFTDNSASVNGGGFSGGTLGGGDFVLTNCVFSGNSAANQGGGFWSFNSSNRYDECTFEDNIASYGGGMWIAEWFEPWILRIKNCTYTNNMATQWGGAAWIGFPESDFGCPPTDPDDWTTSNCMFIGNSASFGGAIFFEQENISEWPPDECVPLYFNECTFQENTASGDGGALYVLQQPPHIGSTDFCGNVSNDIAGLFWNEGGNSFDAECVEACAGDTNEDYNVDILDLLYILAVWGTDNPAGDINGDGWVDVSDVLEVIGNWGVCP